MIGDKIKELRVARGWTQEELAQKMGYADKTAISKIEKNINDVNQSTIKKFAETFGCDVTDFFFVSPITQEDIILIEMYHKSDKVTQDAIKRLLEYSKRINNEP